MTGGNGVCDDTMDQAAAGVAGLLDGLFGPGKVRFVLTVLRKSEDGDGLMLGTIGNVPSDDFVLLVGRHLLTMVGSGLGVSDDDDVKGHA